jgi:hypothetical protein
MATEFGIDRHTAFIGRDFAPGFARGAQKRSGARGILSFAPRCWARALGLAAEVVVANCLATTFLVRATSGSHLSGAKLPSFARRLGQLRP